MRWRPDACVAAIACLVACGGEAADGPARNDGILTGSDNGTKIQSGGGNPGGATSSSGGSGDAGPVASSGTAAGPKDGPAAGPSDVCAGAVTAVDLLPVDVLIVLDRSASMGEPLSPDSNDSKWNSVVSAIQTFASSPEGAGQGIGVQYFAAGPDACQPSSYASPAVPVGPLPDVTSPLLASLEQYDPAGGAPVTGRPTYPALHGALQHMREAATAQPHRAAAVVLISDGAPNQCNAADAMSICPECSTTITDLAALTKQFRDETPSVPTYVISLGTKALVPIGRATGSQDAFVVSEGDVQAQIVDVLREAIYPPVGHCRYDIPPPPDGRNLDFDDVAVRVNALDGTVRQVPQVNAPEECALNGNEGWYYDDPTAPRAVYLCPDSCATASRGTMDLELACAPWAIGQ